MASRLQVDKIVTILKKIDRRLEVLTRAVGYLSILVVTPLFFLMTHLGISYEDLLGIKQLTSAQKEILIELKTKGYKTDEAGALEALEKNDPMFSKFLAAEIYPDRSRSADAIKEIFYKSIIPEFDIDYFRGYLGISGDLKSLAVEYTKRLIDFVGKVNEYKKLKKDGEIRLESSFKSVEEFCRAFPFLDGSGFFLYQKLDKVGACIDSFRNGTAIMYVADAIRARNYWSRALALAAPEEIENDAIISVALLSNSIDVDVSPLDSRKAFASLEEGQIFRFIADTKVDESDCPKEGMCISKALFKIENEDIDSVSPVSIDVIEMYTGIKISRECSNMCKYDLTGLLIGGSIYVLKGVSLGAGNTAMSYSSYRKERLARRSAPSPAP